MTVQFNETQRLQIEAFCLLATGNVGAIRSFMRIADLVALPDPRKEALNFREIPNSGGARVWEKPDDSSQVQIEISKEDAARLRAALEAFEGWNTSRDLPWLEPLLKELI